MFLSLIKTFPEVALSRVAIMLSRVVLPLPDSPIIETNSPSEAEKSISVSASVITLLVLYTFFTFSSFNIVTVFFSFVKI